MNMDFVKPVRRLGAFAPEGAKTGDGDVQPQIELETIHQKRVFYITLDDPVSLQPFPLLSRRVYCTGEFLKARNATNVVNTRCPRGRKGIVKHDTNRDTRVMVVTTDHHTCSIERLV